MPHRTDAPDEDAPMAGQPTPVALTAQQLLEWDEFEERFLDEYRENLKREDAAAELDYQTRKADLTVQLAQWERTKAASEKKVKTADARIVLLQEGLRGLEDEFQVHALNKRVSRNRANFDLKERFRKSRQSGPLDVDVVRQLRLVGPSMMNFPPRDSRPDGNAREGAGASSAAVVGTTRAPGVDGDTPGAGPTGVTICRTDGTPVGNVERLPVEPRVSKNSVGVLLGMPIKRNVVIRDGRRFGPAEVESIHQSNDGRFSKWFSCMIQAVGDERPNPCDICSRNAGPFVSCVRVDDTSPRCGNCEWSRRGCNEAESSSIEGRSATVSDTDANDASTAQQRPSRKSHAAKLDGTGAGDTTRTAKAANARKPAGTAPSPGGAQPDTPAEDLDLDIEQLRSPTITLRHDGKVYLSPPLMAGVPVEKIDPEHEYWEPNWKDPVELIRTTLAGHEEKYNQFIQDPKDKPHHNKYFHGRQVNRGRESLEFLEDGPLHPFQLVAKKWMSPAITTYDTLHRLANTLKELGKFGITVTPADWLRQRLCEIVEVQGENFSLSSTVKDLYHDPKVQALRHASGFGNVGRPVKGMPKGPGGSSRRKRKRKEGDGGTPVKRRKEEPTDGPEEGAEDGFGYEGFTDREDECGVVLGDDDFRLRALRTRRYTTAEAMTQYWHLSPHAGLDLQLLQSADPPAWTTGATVDGQPAEDFSLLMDDVIEVRHHPESLLVWTSLKSGEAVMVSFWRERTKRRLLALWRERCEVRKAESWESLRWEWQKMGVNSRELTLEDFGS